MWSTTYDRQLREMWDSGLSYIEIARSLGVTIKSVKLHVVRLKLDRRPIGSVWTDDAVATLKRLHGEGSSALAISAALGRGISRNAVIGKIHRLGLQRQFCPLSKSMDSKRGAKIRRAKGRKGQLKPAAIAKRAKQRSALAELLLSTGAELPPPSDESIPLEQRRTLVELEAHHCRWPIGDPRHADFAFCGGELVPGLPYCVAHVRVAYLPPKPDAKRPTQPARAVVMRVAKEPA